MQQSIPLVVAYYRICIVSVRAQDHFDDTMKQSSSSCVPERWTGSSICVDLAGEDPILALASISSTIL